MMMMMMMMTTRKNFGVQRHIITTFNTVSGHLPSSYPTECVCFVWP